MNEDTELVVVHTTVDSEEKAAVLAGLLVERKLAACVQSWPIRSTYWWKGKVESEGEFVLAAKTRKTLIDEIVDCIKRNHGYEVPEIIVTPVVGGLPDYLSWVKEESKNPG